jgi:dGTPase
MSDRGGFDHNAQSLRVVTQLERKYAAFDGLNLTLETLDGIVKHNGPVAGPRAISPGGSPLVEAAVREAGLDSLLALDEFAGAEAQVAAIADDIAWHNHDIDDGLRAGLIEIDQLIDVPLVGPLVRDVQKSGTIEPRRAIYEVNRRLITLLIADGVSETRRRLKCMHPTSAAEVRQAPMELVAFSSDVARDLAGLKAFLFAQVYHHPRVTRIMNGAESIVVDLFDRYSRDAGAVPDALAAYLASADDTQRTARIRDYLAGMTDRFAVAEHRRLFDATPELR